MAAKLPKLKDLDVSGKTVLVRLDLNVPMHAGKITDETRIRRSIPTLQYLIEQHAKVVVLSHLGRPDGFDPALSLAPLVDTLSDMLWERHVRFSPDCVGPTAKLAIENAAEGDVILVENLRFYKEEEANDPAFAKAMAELADIYVNDAFSCSHRAHASIVGINKHLPSAAGLLMQEEMAALDKVLTHPVKPLTAIIGGAKVSTKIALFEHLIEQVDHLVIGGAMANTFLAAAGYEVGQSLHEPAMKKTAEKFMVQAKAKGCRLLLPTDVVVAKNFKPHAASKVIEIEHMTKDGTILDIGPRTLHDIQKVIDDSKTLVWNGPLGAFETSPFDATTVQVARLIALASREGKLHSVAGGGDTLAALAHAGLSGELSYLSTAGGAFLEWLEGKSIPGVAALMQSNHANRKRA